MTALTLDQAMATPAGSLADQPAATLFQLRQDATDLLVTAKAIAEHIDRALELKYAEPAQALRRVQGKDTGVVHFDDGAVRITADLPKKVDWNQAKLAEIVRRIAAAGDDPAEFVEISYRVAETKFNAWPESMRRAFEPARTLKTGKPGYRLALLSEGSA